jgi:hypothetical protein
MPDIRACRVLRDFENLGRSVCRKYQVERDEVERVTIGRQLVRVRATMRSDPSHTSIELGKLTLDNLLLNHGSASSREATLGDSRYEPALHPPECREIGLEIHQRVREEPAVRAGTSLVDLAPIVQHREQEDDGRVH